MSRLDGAIALYISDAIIQKMKEVTNRPEFMRRFSASQSGDAALLVDDIIGRTEYVSNVPRVFAIERSQR